jgi:hypothetical protein
VGFVVNFPGAGKKLGTQPLPAGYWQYADRLHDQESNLSEWAPFSTRLEWEVAHWAKLRGPSSTALSELLQIDGVSQLPLTCFTEIEQCNSFSFQKHLGCHFPAQMNLTKSLTTNYQMHCHNLSEKKLRFRGKDMSSIIVTYLNVSKRFMVIQSLQRLWHMLLNSTIQALTRSARYSLR